jgi:hypothetical protein
MWRELGISEQDWQRTPETVRTLLLALQQQVRLMGIRFQAYEKQLAALTQQVARLTISKLRLPNYVSAWARTHTTHQDHHLLIHLQLKCQMQVSRRDASAALNPAIQVRRAT